MIRTRSGEGPISGEPPPFSPPRHTLPTKPQFLALPPPPPATTMSRFYHFTSQPYISTIIKITFFAVKYATLTIPCSPYAANSLVTFSLFILALGDVVDSQHAYFQPHSGHGAGVQRSIGLLALHLVVVSATDRVGILCPVKHGVWDGV